MFIGTSSALIGEGSHIEFSCHVHVLSPNLHPYEPSGKQTRALHNHKIFRKKLINSDFHSRDKTHHVHKWIKKNDFKAHGMRSPYSGTQIDIYCGMPHLMELVYISDS